MNVELVTDLSVGSSQTCRLLNASSGLHPQVKGHRSVLLTDLRQFVFLSVGRSEIAEPDKYVPILRGALWTSCTHLSMRDTLCVWYVSRLLCDRLF